MKKKILWSILLIFLMWMSTCGNNIELFSNAGYDFDSATSAAFYYGTLGTAILTLIMMIIPTLCVIIKRKKLDYHQGLTICKWNSIILFIISIILTVILIENNYTDGFFGVGGLGALMFYFINKWLLVADQKENEIKDNVANTIIESTSEMENNKKEKVTSQERSNNTVRKKSSLLPILLAVALIISVILNINAYIKLEETNSKKDESETNINLHQNSSKDNAKVDFQEKLAYLESIATEVWVSGTMNDTLFDEIIVLENEAYRFIKMWKTNSTYEYYKINFIKDNNDVIISYDDVIFNGTITDNSLILYMADGFTIYAEYLKK